MPRQAKVSASARILSLVDVVATAALLLLIFRIPTYMTAGAGYSSQTGATTESTGSATLFASNPQAFTVLTGIATLAVVALALVLITAWLDSSPVRTALGVVLVPLSALAVLGLFSVGVFIAPLVALGWFVFALCGNSNAHPLSPEPESWS
jgi:hypothetical protein